MIYLMFNNSLLKFPSLTGVIHFLIKKYTDKYGIIAGGFPSLTGVIHFLIKKIDGE